ncbi:hypothetical protein [Comamonas sp.]|uniref:hypothetical protein n=1 Tax=Comamonas sp. TaxID=34028 RepID=UPI00289F1662|nr:hypothetical protein [Comamonas sp.]
MTEQQLKQEVKQMWEGMRAEGEMLVDLPAYKLGMPFAIPGEVVIPFECDGEFVPVYIDPNLIPALVEGLQKTQKACANMAAEADAEYRAWEVIRKAAGGI